MRTMFGLNGEVVEVGKKPHLVIATRYTGVSLVNVTHLAAHVSE